MAKPSVNTRCVANHYAAKDERIVEFSNGSRSGDEYKGGLISFHNLPDGRLRIDLYSLSPGILVVAGSLDNVNSTAYVEVHADEHGATIHVVFPKDLPEEVRVMRVLTK